MNRPQTWFLRLLLAGAVAASFLAIGLRAFADEEEDPIVQNEQQLIQEGRQAFRSEFVDDASPFHSRPGKLINNARCMPEAFR